MSSRSNIIKAKCADISALSDKPLAFIGVGSNLGAGAADPQRTLEQSFTALAELSDSPIAVSSLWETEPIDCPPGSPLFVNAVVALSPRLTHPRELLGQLQGIEQEFGRLRTGERNAPRSLDLDLLSVADTLWNDAVLTLPHPRLQQRAFVVFPLLEIAPEYCLPGTSSKLSELAKSLAGQGVRKLRNNA